MKTEVQKVWIGRLPEFKGYGIAVVETSKEKCEVALFKAWKEFPNKELTFKQAMEYFGGNVFDVEIGKGYFEDFGN